MPCVKGALRVLAVPLAPVARVSPLWDYAVTRICHGVSCWLRCWLVGSACSIGGCCSDSTNPRHIEFGCANPSRVGVLLFVCWEVACDTIN